jgi:hypothetical protein
VLRSRCSVLIVDLSCASRTTTQPLTIYNYYGDYPVLPNILKPLRRTLSAQGLSSEDHSSSSSYLPSWSNDTDTTTSAADKTNNTNLRPKQQKQSRRRLQANCVLGSNPGPACTVNALRNCVNNANQNERIEICNNGITFGPGDASILVQTAVTFTCMGCTDDQIDPVLTLRRTTSANGPDNGRFFNVGNLAINSSLKFIGIRFQRGVYGSASNLQNQSGGAVRITDNNVQNILFRACTFSRNQSAAYGGGVFIQAQNANVSFERCVFDQNLSLVSAYSVGTRISTCICSAIQYSTVQSVYPLPCTHIHISTTVQTVMSCHS